MSHQERVPVIIRVAIGVYCVCALFLLYVLVAGIVNALTGLDLGVEWVNQ